jgi:hypothetical protein
VQPGNPRGTAVVLFIIIAFASLIFLIDIVSGFMLRDAASNLDLSVATLMGELRNAPADAFMIPLTMLAERPIVWAMGLSIAGWLAVWRGWRVSLLILAIMVFAEFASINLSQMVGNGRGLSQGGFTSTPTLMAGLVFGFLAVLASHSMGRWSKAAVAAICASVVVAIAFSRVYLGAELLSGVLVGGLLALILTSLFAMAIEAIPARRIRPLGLMAFATLVLLSTGLQHFSTNIEKAEARYAARPMIQTFSTEDWQQGGWQKLADRRIDLAGHAEEVFTAQWIGGLAQLETALQTKGWKSVAPWRWQDAFSYLDTKATLEKLPPRPALHQGLKAKLTMTLDAPLDPQKRLVLRAYKAHVDVTRDATAEHVYLISITPEAPRSRFYLYAMPTTLPADAKDKQAGLDALSNISAAQIIATSDDPQKTSRVLLAKP